MLINCNYTSYFLIGTYACYRIQKTQIIFVSTEISYTSNVISLSEGLPRTMIIIFLVYNIHMLCLGFDWIQPSECAYKITQSNSYSGSKEAVFSLSRTLQGKGHQGLHMQIWHLGGRAAIALSVSQIKMAIQNPFTYNMRLTQIIIGGISIMTTKYTSLKESRYPCKHALCRGRRQISVYN